METPSRSIRGFRWDVEPYSIISMSEVVRYQKVWKQQCIDTTDQIVSDSVRNRRIQSDIVRYCQILSDTARYC